MIQINPLQSYIDGGARAALTTPPSASLVFDLPGKAIWVKGVKLKGIDHTYTFSHDNYITLTNTPDKNNPESEDINIGVNITTLKNAIDTTYNGGTLALLQEGLNTEERTWQAKILHSYINNVLPTTKNLQINGTNYAIYTTEDSLPQFFAPVSLGTTGQILACTSSGLSWINQIQNTDYRVSQSSATNDNDYRIILKQGADNNPETNFVRFSEYLTFNPSTKTLKINNIKVVTATDIYIGATSTANATAGLVPAATSEQQNYYLRGDGTWVNIATEMATANTWRPIKVGNTDALGSSTDTGTLSFTAGTGITLAWDATNKRIIITNSSPDVNHNTDETVRQVPKTDNVNRPLMMINGSTSAGEQINTSMFSTGIYANASTKMITANGFIKAGSSDDYVLLGGGNHKALSDFSMSHEHPYLPIAYTNDNQTDDWGKNYAKTHYNSYVYNSYGREWSYWIGMRPDLAYGNILRLSHDGLVQYCHKTGGDKDSNWSSWKSIITSDNFNSYSPTLTGIGATGTWNINISGNADTVDGYHVDDILPYGLENLCIGAVASGGQTRLNSDGSITTSGNNSDTYFFVRSTENLIAGQIYTVGFYVIGVPSGNTATWSFGFASQSNNKLVINIKSNGWCWGTGTISGDIVAGENIIFDDRERGFNSSINISKFVIVKGEQKAYYTPPISKMSVNYANSAGNADTVDGLHVHSGRNNEANKIVRTDANGYIQAGWINTLSGDMGTTAATRIYCSDDGYIRYKTISNFRTDLVSGLYWANVKVSASSSTTTYPTFGSLSVINDSCDNGNNSLAYFQHRSNNDWTVKIDSGSYDYGLHINASGTYALYVGPGASRFNGAMIVGADTAPSYKLDVRGTTRSTDRIYANEWIQFDNWTGIYSPNNGAHFYPNNTTSYGQWQLRGNRNGYSGIHFGDSGQYMTIMDSGTHKGIYSEEWGDWILYFNYDNKKLGLRTYSLTSYAVTCQGDFYCRSGWLRTEGDTGWYNESYGGGWYMSDTSWVRTYNSKGIYTSSGTIYNDGHAWFATNSGYNVGIGTSNPTEKLHIVGSRIYWTNGDATLKIYGVATCCGDENVAFQSTFDGKDPLSSSYVTDYRTRSAILLQPRGGNVGINIAHDPSYPLTVGGNVAATHFYENSDIRFKTNFSNIDISINQLSEIPLFDFDWIDNNTIRNSGTSAQFVQQILPNIVSGTDKLTLDYGVLGTIAGITACKELVTQKSELQELKEKVKQLEDKLRKYENTL